MTAGFLIIVLKLSFHYVAFSYLSNFNPQPKIMRAQALMYANLVYVWFDQFEQYFNYFLLLINYLSNGILSREDLPAPEYKLPNRYIFDLKIHQHFNNISFVFSNVVVILIVVCL